MLSCQEMFSFKGRQRGCMWLGAMHVVSYHYYKVGALFPEADSKSVKAIISTGIFCNAQCGRHKLYTAVFERLTVHRSLMRK